MVPVGDLEDEPVAALEAELNWVRHPYHLVQG